MHYAAFGTWLEHCLSRSISIAWRVPGGADANEKNAIEIAEAIAALGFQEPSHAVGRHCRRFAIVLERSGAMDFGIKSGSKN